MTSLLKGRKTQTNNNKEEKNVNSFKYVMIMEFTIVILS